MSDVKASDVSDARLKTILDGVIKRLPRDGDRDAELASSTYGRLIADSYEKYREHCTQIGANPIDPRDDPRIDPENDSDVLFSLYGNALARACMLLSLNSKVIAEFVRQLETLRAENAELLKRTLPGGM